MMIEPGVVERGVWPHEWQNELAGQTAVVTGSGRNLGRAIALAFAQGGANVVINARSNRAEAQSVVDEVRALGGNAIAAIGNVSDAAFAESMIESAVSEFGRIDHVCHSAARRARGGLLEMTVEDWDNVIRLNLSAGFYLARFALPHMMANRTGRIILIGGPDANTGARDRAHSVTAKAGMLGLMKAVALEAGPWGVTVNIVMPGSMDTTRDLADYPGWPPTQEFLDERLAIPRLGQADELAYACRFLASPAAAYITGQTLHVNGGLFMP
ncbi:MAG: SDR family NAD(P)-dependent oxidoreductase [Acidimicrobiia bacterium]